MISVSDNWKEAQKQRLLPYSDIQIEYSVTAPGIQADAGATGSPEDVTSQTSLIMQDEIAEETVKYGTLERNLWVLGDSFEIMPTRDTLANGFVSSVLCGDDGSFSIVPTIVIRLSKVSEDYIPGLTLTWCKIFNEYPTEFRVTTYNGAGVVSQITVSDNATPETHLDFEMHGYDKITIEILKWCLPRRRARMLNCWLGLRKFYTKIDLTDFSHEQSADLLSGELPKNAVVFSLNNTTGIWNPENPDGMERYLITRQSLKIKYGFRINGKIEWIKAGTFWLSEWNTPSNGIDATFTARDLLELCTDTYTGPTAGSLLMLAEAALTQSGVDLSMAVLDSSLAEIMTDFSAENTSYTCAEILQLVANAARCVMWQDRDGVLHIEPLKTTLTDYIIGRLDNGLVNAYKHPEIELTKELKSVSINDGLGTASNSSTGVIEKAQNPLIVDAETAAAVAEWCRDCLKNRSLISGEFRPDPRLDALDLITVVSKYSSSPVYVTNIKYTYNGAFRGTYSGRVIKEG